MESKLLHIYRTEVLSHPLLIEPVWNRNNIVVTMEDLYDIPFNRTSMESKLATYSIFNR